MNMWHLKYFYEAARAGSLKSASEKFTISSSAVSQAIKSLESELEVDLLVHRKRFFELTDAGKMFYEKIPTLIEQLEALSEDLKSGSQEPRGLVTFGVPRSLISLQLAEALLQLKKKYPLLRFRIRGGVTSEIKKSLKNGDIQYGILLDDNELGEFSSKEISTGRFVLITRNKKNNLKKSKVIITDAGKVEVIHLFNETKKKYKLIPEVEFEINSWSVITEMIKKTDLIGLVPDFVARNDIDRGKLFESIEEVKPFSYSTKVIWPLNKQMPKGAELLLAELQRVLKV